MLYFAYFKFIQTSFSALLLPPSLSLSLVCYQSQSDLSFKIQSPLKFPFQRLISSGIQPNSTLLFFSQKAQEFWPTAEFDRYLDFFYFPNNAPISVFRPTDGAAGMIFSQPSYVTIGN